MSFVCSNFEFLFMDSLMYVLRAQVTSTLVYPLLNFVFLLFSLLPSDDCLLDVPWHFHAYMGNNSKQKFLSSILTCFEIIYPDCFHILSSAFLGDSFSVPGFSKAWNPAGNILFSPVTFFDLFDIQLILSVPIERIHSHSSFGLPKNFLNL